METSFLRERSIRGPPAQPANSPAIHGPDPHGHLDRCHCSSRPGPRGSPPAQRPATEETLAPGTRLPPTSLCPRPSTRPEPASSGGPTCTATEHAQSGSSPRDSCAGIWRRPGRAEGRGRDAGAPPPAVAKSGRAASCGLAVTEGDRGRVLSGQWNPASFPEKLGRRRRNFSVI